MQQQTISVSQNPNVTIHSIPGDLRVAGWERAEIMAKTDGDALNLQVDAGGVLVSCDENLILYLPRAASLDVDNVNGDASLQALSGTINIGPVAGDLSLTEIGAVTLDAIAGDASLRSIGGLSAAQVSGDFSLRGGRGDCAVSNIGGDASFRDVDGAITLENVGSDLFLRSVRGSVIASAGADATLYLEPQPGKDYIITAGDDLLLRLPPNANVELNLTASLPESLHVDFPNIELAEDSSTQTIKLGSGTARMFLTAGDELIITSKAEKWDSAADFGVGMGDTSEWSIPPIPPISPIPPIPADLSERINQRVQAAMERHQVHAEAASRRAEVKIAAAMRRAEAKARAAEVRARRWKVEYTPPGSKPSASININTGRWKWDQTPRGPVESGEPVSDEERLSVLKMLQEKKISLEEAEKLLAALEGK